MKCSLLAGFFGGMVALGPALKAEETLVLTLDQAIAHAIGVSPELRAAAIQENSSLDSYHWGLREYLPKLGVSYSQNDSVLIDSPDTRSVQAGLTLTQLLFDAGRNGRKRDLSRIALQSNRNDYQIQLEQVTDTVTGLFNQILVLKKKMEIQDQVIDLAEKQLIISRKELDLGSALEIDVLDTAAQVSSLKVAKKQFQRSLADTLFQLVNLLCLDLTAPVDVEGQFESEYPGLTLPESSEHWLALTLDSSKDLAQKNLDLRKQYFAMLDSDYWYLPDISLETTASLAGSTFPLQTPAFNATVTFSFPNQAFPMTQTAALGATPGQSRTSSFASKVGILDSVQGFVDSSGARAQYQVSELKESALRASTRYSLEKTMGDYSLLVEKLSLQRNTVALEVRKNAILSKQVDLGEAKRLDYLQSETQLANDQISLVESVLQIKESERRLEQLLHLRPGSLAQAVEEEK